MNCSVYFVYLTSLLTCVVGGLGGGGNVREHGCSI